MARPVGGAVTSSEMAAAAEPTRNLAKDRPEKVRELAALWAKQFEEYAALAAKDLPPDAKTDRRK